MFDLRYTLLDAISAKTKFSIDLYELFSTFYENTSFDQFSNDLDNKNNVLVLHEGERLSSSNIIGFSTLEEYSLTILGMEVVVFFNGDTIIHPKYWGTTIMARAWASLFFNKKNTSPNKTFFWFLISSGHRTYRLLPSFFKNYYPRVDRIKNSKSDFLEETCYLKNILEIIAKDKFGESFDPKTGLICLKNPTPLKSEMVLLNSKKSQNPRINFFLSANKDHALGVELACIAEISLNNLNKSGLKLLNQKVN
jgi:hypothetical protein